MKKYTLIFSFILFIVSCNEQRNNKIKKIEVKKVQNINGDALHVLKEYYANSVGDTLLIINSDTLVAFRFFADLIKPIKLIFTDKGKMTALGDTLYNIISNSRAYGLIAQDYCFDKLDSLKGNFYDVKAKAYNVSCIAAFEAFLTEAYLKFGAHLNKGRFNPDSLRLEWNPKKLDSNWINILKYGLENHIVRSALDSLEPRHDGYRFLKLALGKFVAENKTTNWDSISFVNVGDSSVFYEELKQRLISTNDYFDALKGKEKLLLKDAIKSFQRKFNLEPDGKLGKYTKQALGLSKELTIRQMEMALERWRWEPSKFPTRYAMVNIPSAEINVWEWNTERMSDSLILHSRVVVGKPENQTPILNSKINYMLIYPYWNVPYNIAWKEILPMVKADTNYLHRHNFEVLNSRGEVVSNLGSLNWKKFSKQFLPIRFRQRIGNENSLGIIKFNFNNKYGVYLHDTNSKRYFKTFYRFQSHGCIRLEKYTALARFLIRDDTLRIPYDTLNAYFNREVQQKIVPKKPLPIYLRYYTATADSNLNINLYLDIYSKDQKLIQVLYAKKNKENT